MPSETIAFSFVFSKALQLFWDFFSSEPGLVLVGALISILTTTFFEKAKDNVRRRILRIGLLEKFLSVQDYSIKVGNHILSEWNGAIHQKEPLPIINMRELFGSETKQIELSSDELIELFSTKLPLIGQAKKQSLSTSSFVQIFKDLISAHNQIANLTERYNATVLDLEAFVLPFSRGELGQPKHALEIPVDQLMLKNSALVKGEQYVKYLAQLITWTHKNHAKIETETIARLRMRGRKAKFDLTDAGAEMLCKFEENLRNFEALSKK